jgi:G:T-mismatch repair DNA endonuclease (very short patch repair protein)
VRRSHNITIEEYKDAYGETKSRLKESPRHLTESNQKSIKESGGVTCKICGIQSHDLSNHIKYTHCITTTEYRDAFSSPIRSDKFLKEVLSNSGSVSKTETEFFNALANIGLRVDTQYILKDDSSKYIFDGHFNNNLIEFNGDYWHCNPEKYKAEYYNPTTKMTAKEHWERDYKKTQSAISSGYRVIVVWEHDYKKEPRKVLEDVYRELLNTLSV